MRLARIAVGALVGFIAAPSFACSGPGTQGYAYEADVIVAGTLIDIEGASVDEVATSKVIKGVKADRYVVEWRGSDYSDECAAFVTPSFRHRGVYFLKRRIDGKYLILWTEKRWNKRWKTGS